MEAKLVIIEGEGKGKEYALAPPAILGRSKNAAITVAHPLASRQHCEVYEREGDLVVRDLGSLNGTFIGETRIAEEVLRPGELLTVGGVTFQAVYGGFSGPIGVIEPATSADSPAQGTSLEETAAVDEPASDADESDVEEVELVDLEESDAQGSDQAGAKDQSAASDDAAQREQVPILNPAKPPPADPTASDIASFSQSPKADEDDDGLDDFLKSLGR